MNTKKSSNLTIYTRDFNLVARQAGLLAKLRKLTLYSTSGMNKELDSLIKLMETRPVDAKVILAYVYPSKLVGWALLSRERSAIRFYHSDVYFRPGDGLLFEVFVDPEYRRQGIGSKLLQTAKRKANGTRLCVAPWDDRSFAFYERFSDYKLKAL